jgi:lantibiotic modifying enzyme
MSTTSARTTTWAPILDGPESSRAWTVIEDIARALETPVSYRGIENALMDGRPGPSLFLGYLAMATGDDAVRHRAIEMLERSVDGLVDVSASMTMMTGFTGVAWAVEHLQGRAWESPDEDLNATVDETILRSCAGCPWTRPGRWVTT